MQVFEVLMACALCGAGVEEVSPERKLGEMLAAARWSIGPEVSWFHYEEPGLMEEDGTLYGVSASYTSYRQAQYEPALFRLEGGFSAGQVDYDGGLMDGTPYSVEGNDDYLLNVRALYGPLWETDEWANHFYAGLAYRYLQDDMSDDPHGYRRHSNYLYLPLGFRRDNMLSDRWSFGFGGEVDFLIVGLQVSQIPEIDGGGSSIENWQFPGIGARGTLEMRYRTDSLDLALTPFIQYWYIDDSRPSSSGPWYEPRNWSLQYGLGLVGRF